MLSVEVLVDQHKIKSTPPQSSPALCAREEAGATARATATKSKIKMDPSFGWDDVIYFMRGAKATGDSNTGYGFLRVQALDHALHRAVEGVLFLVRA